MRVSVASGKTKSIMITKVDLADYNAILKMALENERSVSQHMRWIIKREVSASKKEHQ